MTDHVLPVGEDVHDPGSATDLAVESLLVITGPDLSPDLRGLNSAAPRPRPVAMAASTHPRLPSTSLLRSATRASTAPETSRTWSHFVVDAGLGHAVISDPIEGVRARPTCQPCKRPPTPLGCGAVVVACGHRRLGARHPGTVVVTSRSAVVIEASDMAWMVQTRTAVLVQDVAAVRYGMDRTRMVGAVRLGGPGHPMSTPVASLGPFRTCGAAEPP